MLAQRLRRWPNIKTALFQRVVFGGLSVRYVNIVMSQIGINKFSYYIICILINPYPAKRDYFRF